MKVVIGADHRGFALKEDLKLFLSVGGYAIHDVGAHEYVSTDDYPVFAEAVAHAVINGEAERGIVLCGSGVGVCIAANKIYGVRAVDAHSVSEAQEAREHQDVNVLTLSADRLDEDTARAIALAFLTTDFSEEERHARRIAQIAALESKDVFDEWCSIKRETNAEKSHHYFREGDVFFVRMGKNIGFEQDGKGDLFLRPVLIVRKFNKDIFFGVALTTHLKHNPFYIPIGSVRGQENVAILSQSRLYDARRLDYRLGKINAQTLALVRTKLRSVLKL